MLHLREMRLISELEQDNSSFSSYPIHVGYKFAFQFPLNHSGVQVNNLLIDVEVATWDAEENSTTCTWIIQNTYGMTLSSLSNSIDLDSGTIWTAAR